MMWRSYREILIFYHVRSALEKINRLDMSLRNLKIATMAPNSNCPALSLSPLKSGTEA
jgi:hypothetical protein